MPLLDPTPGQLFDRATVLRLKLDFAQRRGLKAEHLREELRKLDGVMDMMRCGKGPAMLPEQRERMEEIHARMWHHLGWLDTVAAATPENAMPVAQIALDLHALNKERWALIEEIDKANGRFAGKEKLP